ncbi:MAG: outer membrane protein assembly factor BamE [Thalassotalea sp.]
MLQKLLIIVFIFSVSACSSWVYRIDVPQGNYLDKKGVEQLQIGMTKEQVKFVLGSPVVVDSFNDDVWHYVYRFKSGRDESFNIEKLFVVKFNQGKLFDATGDFELPESFNTPMEN